MNDQLQGRKEMDNQRKVKKFARQKIVESDLVKKTAEKQKFRSTWAQEVEEELLSAT